MNTKHVLVVLAAAALLAGCGGGSEDPMAAQPATNEVPASASASAEAFSTFASSLEASETSEPLNLKKFVPPTSETAEPIPVS